MVAQLPDNSWSKLLTFVLSSKQECAEYGIRSDHRRYESVPTIASNAAHLVFSFSRRSVSLPSVTSSKFASICGLEITRFLKVTGQFPSCLHS